MKNSDIKSTSNLLDLHDLDKEMFVDWNGAISRVKNVDV